VEKLCVPQSDCCTSCVVVVHPEHPINAKAADDACKPEHLSMQQKGIACSLFDFDGLVGGNGEFRPRPPNESVIGAAPFNPLHIRHVGSQICSAHLQAQFHHHFVRSSTAFPSKMVHPITASLVAVILCPTSLTAVRSY